MTIPVRIQNLSADKRLVVSLVDLARPKGFDDKIMRRELRSLMPGQSDVFHPHATRYIELEDGGLATPVPDNG